MLFYLIGISVLTCIVVFWAGFKPDLFVDDYGELRVYLVAFIIPGALMSWPITLPALLFYGLGKLVRNRLTPKTK